MLKDKEPGAQRVEEPVQPPAAQPAEESGQHLGAQPVQDPVQGLGTSSPELLHDLPWRYEMHDPQCVSDWQDLDFDLDLSIFD